MNLRLFGIVALLAVVVTAGCLEQAAGDFVTYENTAYGIRIQHPQTWEVKEESTGILFLSPTDLSDDFRENVNIVVAEMPIELPLDSYFELEMDLLEQTYPGITIVESGETTLANGSARRVVYTMVAPINEKQVKCKILQVFAIRNKKAYVITYFAKEETYSDYMEVVQKMIDSFEIL